MSATGKDGHDGNDGRPKPKAKLAFAPLEPSPPRAAPPRWVIPLVMILTLTIGGWFVIDNLAANSKLEDCTMSGRKNCVPPIDTSNLAK